MATIGMLFRATRSAAQLASVPRALPVCKPQGITALARPALSVARSVLLSSRLLDTEPVGAPVHYKLGDDPRRDPQLAFDKVEIERLLAERVHAQRRGEYETADRIQQQLFDMNVLSCKTTQMYWVVPADIGDMIRERHAARMIKDFQTADALREKILAAGHVMRD